MHVISSQYPSSGGRSEPAQLRHERDTLGLTPLYVTAGSDAPRPVVAVHRDVAHGVWKHAYADYHTVTFHVAGAPLFRRRKRRDSTTDVAAAGSVSVQSCDEESLWDSDACLCWVQLYLPVAMLANLATQALDVDGRQVTLARSTGFAQPRLLRFAYAAWLARRAGDTPLAADEIDAWAHAVAEWLLRAHSNVGQRFPALRRERLTSARFRTVREFIDAHLAAPITIADLARECTMSEFHFIRAFATTAGQSPHQYLIDCRVQRACHLLQSTNASVADIAYTTGFANQAHLTSTFKRILGLTPARYRNDLASACVLREGSA